jgi:predicted ATP-grasp superfamily ATP-dependent carboligase
MQGQQPLPSFGEPRVLLLDAQLRHAVAIARSLGSRGIKVLAAAKERRFPAKYSRYVDGTVSFPDGGTADALDTLLSIVEQRRIQVVIAAGLPGNDLLCRYRDELTPHVLAPFNDHAAFLQLSNKEATMQLAESLDVPYPRTVSMHEPDQADEVAERLGLPVVFKSPLDQGTVVYARDAGELRRLSEEFLAQRAASGANAIHPLAQEYIEGEGHGFYALAERGKLLAYFMHRRLHEYPPSGGPTAMAVSYRDPVLLDLGRRFFSATEWHGVAMVEFRRSRRDGRYYLLEVNPKFWGSLDLSVASGVDFPLLLYRMLTGAPIEGALGAYRDGVIFRSLTMDLAHAVATRRLRSYARSFWDDRIVDDFRRNDPLPSVALMLAGMRRVLDGEVSRSQLHGGARP